MFLLGHSIVGNTWARRSASILEEWGISDWPAWNHPGSSLEQYKAYVRGVVTRRCNLEWKDAVSTHALPVRYLDVRPDISADLAAAFVVQLGWPSMMLQRSLCRLRAGLLDMGHLDRGRSSASRRRCIFCDMPTLSITFHVLCRCEVWSGLRQAIWQLSPVAMPSTMQGQVVHILSASPADAHYCAVLALAGSLDRDEWQFWEG